MTKAVLRVWPELMRPRRSSFSLRKVSVSSSIKVGFHFSIERNSALGLMLLASKGSLHSLDISVLKRVLPHLFSGEVIIAKGATRTSSMNQVKLVQRVRRVGPPV